MGTTSGRRGWRCWRRRSVGRGLYRSRHNSPTLLPNAQHTRSAPPVDTTAATWWYFSGADDLALRACLATLDDFIAPNPEDRQVAALVLRLDEQENPARRDTCIGAWTAEGALTLAELLRDEFTDVRSDPIGRFAHRNANPS